MIREQTLSVWQNRVRMRVLSDGSGPPLVYYHGPWGLTWDPFLQALAQRFTVYAPASSSVVSQPAVTRWQFSVQVLLSLWYEVKRECTTSVWPSRSIQH